MDKLRAIRFFCRAVESKSFTAAAVALGVPQSSLSKAISALEADLHFTLFNRSTRRLSLTESGADYYERCRQILSDIEDAEAVARKGTLQATGTLRVGIHPVLQLPICQRIREFVEANPHINVEIAYANSLTALLDNGLDVLLRIGSIEDCNFVARCLGSTQQILCASPAYLEIHGRPKHPRELNGHRAIVPEESFARWILSRGEEREAVTVAVSVVLREGAGLGVSAAAGLGIALMYDIAARPFLEDGSVEPVLEEWSFGQQPIHAVIPNGRSIPAKVRAFVEFARSLVP